jgi:hypothetical protein
MSVKAPAVRLTAPQAAELRGVSLEKIHAFIRSGEVRAIDVSQGRGQRPRYRIHPADLEAFEQARRVCPPPKLKCRRHKQAVISRGRRPR